MDTLTTMDTLKKYRVILYWSDIDNAYIAEMPELPYTAADGQTPEEALANVYASAARWMETAKQKGWKIPTPQSIEVAA